MNGWSKQKIPYVQENFFFLSIPFTKTYLQMNRGSPLPGVDAVQDYGLLLGQVVPATIKNTLH